MIFYNAFSPSNFVYCDSNEYDKFGVLLLSHCKPNIDSTYNDTINQYFKIKGVENFPYNDLKIYHQNDSTSSINHFYNYSNILHGDRIFNGSMIDTTIYGTERQRLLSQGKYFYKFKIYTDKQHSSVLDTFSGHFCIIRNKEMTIQGCEGANPMDPMLH